ncbi:MAG: hypothetical protein Q9216_001859 [Gyalolechia sp. 2 TL-2023]
MVKTDCKDGLRTQIHFQSCWNGKDLYKSDNSHVEYMSGIDNGKCPPSHPVAMMHIFFEVLYGVNNIKQDGGKFVFSHGDTTGFGFHGDFLNGWKADVLTDAVKNCAFTEGGDVQDCAAFKPSLDPQFSKTCPELPSLLTEPVHGIIDRLPGCITITSGPQDATAADVSCSGGSTSVKESLHILNSTLDAGTNLSGITNSLLPKVSAIKVPDTEVSATQSSTSFEATASSQAVDDEEVDTTVQGQLLESGSNILEERSVPDDEYGSYTFELPPTVTSRYPGIPLGSPVPRRRNKRSLPHSVVPEHDPGSYTFEFPPTVTSRYPGIPLGSPAPHRRNKRSFPHNVVPEQDSGSYAFEFPPTVTSHPPWSTGQASWILEEGLDLSRMSQKSESRCSVAVSWM